MGTPYDTPSIDDHPQAIFERGERIDSDSVWIEWTERVEATDLAVTAAAEATRIEV